MPVIPKALGIDYGDARIGVAVSDALGMLAHPVETITRAKHPSPVRRVAELAAHHAASIVVLGLPLRLDGSEGDAVAKVKAFAAKLQDLLPAETAIVYVDERLTTVQAQAHLRHAGKNARETKGMIDQAAATIILQDWLDQQNGPQSLLLPDPWRDES